MLVNKTVEFFLSEAAGWSWRSAGSGGGLVQDTGDQITWAGSGLGAARDRTGCRRGLRLGPGRDAVDQITWACREKINSKESAL